MWAMIEKLRMREGSMEEVSCQLSVVSSSSKQYFDDESGKPGPLRTTDHRLLTTQLVIDMCVDISARFFGGHHGLDKTVILLGPIHVAFYEWRIVVGNSIVRRQKPKLVQNFLN